MGGLSGWLAVLKAAPCKKGCIIGRTSTPPV